MQCCFRYARVQSEGEIRMILRRIADAFRKQDWATVTIEFFVVVVGIFVGLQVDNWNQIRKDQACLLYTSDAADE